ncbi:hypothetical protein BWK63_08655 [Flavobacterium covae]|uniref:Uncharacterized protein n=1 Tax=Flavobacterium covae TaxID=2906076 RepID=A0ABW8PGG1_9FLAO|nr:MULTISPECIES: hypothetical protein [Flavobacterium]OWP80882.1 hypothetical protein BWK63_08655 [Flavobacterium covae]POR22830.1 hypothetical protein BWK57_04520 [Flavobacterium columnare]
MSIISTNSDKRVENEGRKQTKRHTKDKIKKKLNVLVCKKDLFKRSKEKHNTNFKLIKFDVGIK